MAECAFDLALAEWADREWEELANAPELEASKKYDRAMQRIFRRYEKNTRKLRQHAEVKVGSTTKRVLIVVLAVFLALIAGCSAYFVLRGFNSTTYPDCVEVLFYNGKDDCPTTLENRYYLSGLSDDYEMIAYTYMPTFISSLYQNKQTGQRIRFKCSAKPNYIHPVFFDTENGALSEIIINGGYGLYYENRKPSYDNMVRVLDVIPDDSNSRLNTCIWDNGDYIFEICSVLPKKEIIDLAKSTKVL